MRAPLKKESALRWMAMESISWQDRFVQKFWQEIVFPTFGRRPFCSDFWQETIFVPTFGRRPFVPTFGRRPFCSNFWQETVLFRSGRRPFPTFGRRPCIDLAGDRFQLLAGDHVSIWQETVFRSDRRPCSDLTGDRFRLLAGDRFVPSFGRGPFCSIFWQGTVLFHLLAGDRFVPSFGRGPFCSIFWQGTVLYFTF